jgi:opacity protein-like surface antigen
MFKRLIVTGLLVFALASPAAAEVNGVYAGLKFIDSIQSTGHVSKTNLSGWGVGSYAQNTVGGGVFVGYDFHSKFRIPVRAEIEYAVRTNMNTSWSSSYDYSSNIDARWNLQTLFVNAYFDFHNSTSFTPYIGAGIGVGFINNTYKGFVSGYGVELDLYSKTKMNAVFAWNVGVGCSYAFTENVSVDLAYRFVGLGYNEVSARPLIDKTKIGTSPYANEFSLGLRFTF